MSGVRGLKIKFVISGCYRSVHLYNSYFGDAENLDRGVILRV